MKIYEIAMVIEGLDGYSLRAIMLGYLIGIDTRVGDIVDPLRFEYQAIHGEVDSDKWTRALGLAIYWSFEGLLQEGEFTDE